MLTVDDVARFLDEFAPPALAEAWDNVGLLIGDRRSEVLSALTCLTLTPDVAAEAIRSNCQLVVTHHPVLFRAVKTLTADNAEGEMLLRLIRAGVAVYAPHTRYDSAAGGINAQLASQLGLQGVQPLRPFSANDPNSASSVLVGGGRYGDLSRPVSLAVLLESIKTALGIANLQYVGDRGASIQRVAVACGSAAEFLPDAIRSGCQAFVTGEARIHACLDARQQGIALILAGHYATERPAMERLAETLAKAFPALTVFGSREERDPVAFA